MLSAGRSGRFHGALPGRSVILAMAAANGIRAAQAAKDGVGGDPALLDGPWLKDAQGIDAKLEALTAGLGSGSIYPRDDDQAVLLGQAGDRRGRGVHDSDRRRRFARYDQQGRGAGAAALRRA